ncbi:division/cell wall cluster transcriptional repressor MraZ [Candidatus Parcubacteria bacterium]|nr:division/cell wall cluster transcriptional repressor MraZ [Candidatus Parcubacteria bacterium]
MFIGEYKHNLDDKGRLAVPAKFRNALREGAVVTKGLDNCLFLYSFDEWKKEAEKFSKLPINQSKARAFARHMLAGAMEVEFDKQGRITLPEYLRKFAGLTKKAVVTGVFDRLEIWDAEVWDKYKTNSDADSVEIAEALGEFGV